MNKYWIENLPGMPPLPPHPAGYCRADRITASFVEEGYFVEYFEYPFDRDRTVAMFYGPGEFIIRTHPAFSSIQSLHRSSIVDFSYSNIFRTLRNFPESKLHYRKVKAMCQQKIADRLKLARLNKDTARYRFVLEKQPWVLKQVPDHLLAGYLGITIPRLRELKQTHKL